MKPQMSWNLKCGNLQKTPQNCLEVPATRAGRLFVLTRPIKFLIFGVIIAAPVVDAVAHFYHICYITVCISKRETRFIIQVHGHVSTEQYKNKRQPFLRSYCCRNPNNCSPFCCLFPILQQWLNDRVADTIANFRQHCLFTNWFS